MVILAFFQQIQICFDSQTIIFFEIFHQFASKNRENFKIKSIILIKRHQNNLKMDKKTYDHFIKAQIMLIYHEGITEYISQIYLCNIIIQKQIPFNMEQTNNIFLQSSYNQPLITYYSSRQLNSQDDQINAYLILNSQNNIPQNQIKVQLYRKKENLIQNAQKQSGEHQINQKLVVKKQKSLFHNFQKHLIGLIKKNMALVIQRKQPNQTAKLAFNLWKSFMKIKSFNKKVLHILFGFDQQSSSDDQLIKLKEQFPQFKTVIKNYSLSEIIEAQQFMRIHVIEKSKRITKQSLQSQCKIKKFQEFYCYYQIFLKEISEGTMSKRITKTNKIQFLQKNRE